MAKQAKKRKAPQSVEADRVKRSSKRVKVQTQSSDSSEESMDDHAPIIRLRFGKSGEVIKKKGESSNKRRQVVHERETMDEVDQSAASMGRAEIQVPLSDALADEPPSQNSESGPIHTQDTSLTNQPVFVVSSSSEEREDNFVEVHPNQRVVVFEEKHVNEKETQSADGELVAEFCDEQRASRHQKRKALEELVAKRKEKIVIAEKKTLINSVSRAEISKDSSLDLEEIDSNNALDIATSIARQVATENSRVMQDGEKETEDAQVVTENYEEKGNDDTQEDASGEEITASEDRSFVEVFSMVDRNVVTEDAQVIHVVTENYEEKGNDDIQKDASVEREADEASHALTAYEGEPSMSYKPICPLEDLPEFDIGEHVMNLHKWYEFRQAHLSRVMQDGGDFLDLEEHIKSTAEVQSFVEVFSKEVIEQKYINGLIKKKKQEMEKEREHQEGLVKALNENQSRGFIELGLYAEEEPHVQQNGSEDSIDQMVDSGYNFCVGTQNQSEEHVADTSLLNLQITSSLEGNLQTSNDIHFVHQISPTAENVQASEINPGGTSKTAQDHQSDDEARLSGENVESLGICDNPSNNKDDHLKESHGREENYAAEHFGSSAVVTELCLAAVIVFAEDSKEMISNIERKLADEAKIHSESLKSLIDQHKREKNSEKEIVELKKTLNDGIDGLEKLFDRLEKLFDRPEKLFKESMDKMLDEIKLKIPEVNRNVPNENHTQQILCEVQDIRNSVKMNEEIRSSFAAIDSNRLAKSIEDTTERLAKIITDTTEHKKQILDEFAEDERQKRALKRKLKEEKRQETERRIEAENIVEGSKILTAKQANTFRVGYNEGKFPLQERLEAFINYCTKEEIGSIAIDQIKLKESMELPESITSTTKYLFGEADNVAKQGGFDISFSHGEIYRFFWCFLYPAVFKDCVFNKAYNRDLSRLKKMKEDAERNKMLEEHGKKKDG